MMRHTSFSICGMNPMSRAVLIMLKPVWKVASAKVRRTGSWTSAVVSMPTMWQTSRTNGKKKMSIHKTPNTLNSRCAMAARRAWVLALIAARLAVSVVPIFSPITRAMPWKMEMAPVEQRTMVMAIRAAELWTMAVRTVPISRNSRTVQ